MILLESIHVSGLYCVLYGPNNILLCLPSSYLVPNNLGGPNPNRNHNQSSNLSP